MPRNITFTVSKILKSIPDNLIISNNNEREALKDLLLCVKNNEESIIKPIKGHLYQDPTLQSLKDKLQNKKNFSHTKYFRWSFVEKNDQIRFVEWKRKKVGLRVGFDHC